ncbi:cephalosporin hydroxylase family protein [Candidatus Oscillochloris fontis]|uniref:cephalosporin hydroxylase family protein n=1 Tax=Candidatus Oscillochloris fontis TaxID=2496868 RepID=UPI00101E1820|nr:CmcI family methyltransferase [Candidatus Oscillochloris fontis]
MRLTIDTEAKTLVVEEHESAYQVDLYSKTAFELLSHHWLKVGWNQKYPYTFSWMGRPIIQIPEDMIRMQEVIYHVQPDVIVETGVAHGGSLIFYASLCKAMERGRIIGVDIEIRPHNRVAIEAHELARMITLIEGSSVDPAIVAHVHSLIKPSDKVLVILDSNHTYQHVLAELEAYHDLVTPGSYIVATDGSMGILHDVPRGQPSWLHDNPTAAAHTFAQQHPNFVIEQPVWPFNESDLTNVITHWPDAWLRRIA